ncbi:MAG: tetratricopeptide repeat protein [Deltaproteobacteria bacterium]|nr:MAG: tetratricopeptide repeat protein [Deltaproteobacteria bacterium]
MLALLMLLPALAGGVSDARTQVVTNPEDAGAWVALGDAYKKALKPKKARAAYYRAQGLDPENLEARSRIAELGGGRSKLERRALRRLDDDEVWGDLGDEYLASGRSDDALAAYQYAATLDPGDSEWQGKIAELLGPDAVYEMYTEGASGMSDEELGDIGDLLVAQGDLERACELYQRANELDPGDSEWADKLSSTCGQVPGGMLGFTGEGGFGLGSVDLSASVADDPMPPEAEVLADTAQALALMGEDAQALAFYRRALDLAPEDEKLRSAVLILGGENLVDLLESLVLREPESDELWGDLGDAYAAVGQREQAARAWDQALQLDPEDREWGYKLGLADPARLVPSPKAESIRELLETK